jgi:hypothetical protein
VTAPTSTMGSSIPSFPTHSLAATTSAMPRIYPPASSWSQPPLLPTSSAATLPAPTVPSDIKFQRFNPVSSSSDGYSHLHAYTGHPPMHMSPAVIYDRNSPYRPVRRVNTLLYPPPPTSLQWSRKLSTEQMYYQPLRKIGGQRKTGLLPYYPHDGSGDHWAHSSVPSTTCPPSGHRYGISG